MATDPAPRADNTAASKKFDRLLRSNRVLLQGSLADEVSATGHHAKTGPFRGVALDLSIHGVRLAVETTATPTPTFMLGDRLEDLVLLCGDVTIHSGVGTVVHTRASGEANDGKVELGIYIERAGIDLETVHRRGAGKSATGRWALTRSESEFDSVSSEFRAWVSELAAFLTKAQTFLDTEEAAMISWDLATRTSVSAELLNAVAPDVIARMNLAGQELHQLVGHLPKTGHADYRAYVHKYLGALLSCSPFLHRARAKPLGYAGDYEMMNMLYREHAEGSSLFGKALNLYATQSPVAQANINRIEFLGREIMAAIARKPSGRVRIASVGSGPAQEIQTFLTKYPELGPRLEVALIDQEELAISYCERALAPIAAKTDAKVRVIRESVRRLLTDKKLGQVLGTCELIYSAGLFDYLNDRTFDALLGTLRNAMTSDGTLLIGNVAEQNPDRWAMEYFTEWFLNHRSPQDLRERAATLKPAPASVDVSSEPLGVNLFLVIRH
jgi:extracellular factor (EF) 3-hydroxypalmitic acid methyl ester biosynthesis protein